MQNMQACGRTIRNLIFDYVYAPILTSYCLVGDPTLNSVGDYVEDTILQAIVYQFQSERGGGVHMHLPAYVYFTLGS